MLGFHSQKKYKIKSSFRSDVEPQEIFLDNLAQKKEREMGITERKLEIPLSRKFLQGFLILSAIIILILFSKTFQLQIIDYKNYLLKSQSNKFVIRSVESARGVIYDSKGKQLVFNEPSFDLMLNKKDYSEEKTLKNIATILNITEKELKGKIDESKEDNILIQRNISNEALIVISAKLDDLPGFEIQKNSVRKYEDSGFYSHLIGYTGQIRPEELNTSPEEYTYLDYIGRDGIEKTYEDALHKNPGRLQIERDVFGNIISKKIVTLPESGKSLVLWLDADLQKKIAIEMERVFKSIGAKRGSAIALDPKTGGVLALVNMPTFDNNLFNKGTDVKELNKLFQDKNNPLFNRAIAGVYPTGSTIKPLTAVAALEEKLISPAKTINCEGQIVIENKYNPELSHIFKDNAVHGITDMKKALAESCNVYFFTIGGGFKSQEGLGPAKIKKYLELFGWGNKTNIDLPGESKGFIPSPEWKKETKKENWWDGDTYNLSIGQGDLQITPLQVATAFTAIANNGTLFQPQIVKEIIRGSFDEKKDIEEIAPKIIKTNFIEQENIKIVREGMRQGVTGENSPRASSITLNSLPVKVAAKTGTAQIGVAGFYNNWVTVFAPYDDPQIVLTVMVESVEGLQGATLPIAKEVLNWYFSK